LGVSKKNAAAVALGRLGGLARSKAKTRAARENGRLGGLARATNKAGAATRKRR
jgi:hypothetical protein